MSCRLGLSVGESFAELCSISLSSQSQRSEIQRTPIHSPQPTRWFLPRRNLTDGLREALGPDVISKGGHLTIATSLAAHSFTKRLGSTPAFLVTAGFEQWLDLQTPILPRYPSLHPTRAWTPLSSDHIFGISERNRADGSQETPVAIDDLQFLAAKLELLKTRVVAIGLLHSDVNPTHERQIRDFFVERGFAAFCSHDFRLASDQSRGELARWQRTIHAAYAHTALSEQRLHIEQAFGEHLANWEITFAASNSGRMQTQESAESNANDDAGSNPTGATGSSSNGAAGSSAPHPSQTKTPGFETAVGLQEALAHWTQFEATSKKSPSACLHLGLERFFLLLPGREESRTQEWGPPAFESVKHRILELQPTSDIGLVDNWPMPVISESGRGYEPGPMMFSKSLNPTILDILFALGRISTIEAFSALVQERTRPRILETLFTMAKNIPDKTSIDPMQIASDLETSIIERINQDFVIDSVAGTVMLTGALAPAFQASLAARRPDLKFVLSEQTEWAESMGCANLAD